MTAGGDRLRPSSSPNRLSSSARRRMLHRISLSLELEELVPQHRRELEVQLFGGGLHLLLEQPDQRFSFPRVRGAPERRTRRLGGLRVRNPRGKAHLVHRLDDRAGRDLVFGVVRLRSEEHTSELQSQSNLVCRLLLEKKNKQQEGES